MKISIELKITLSIFVALFALAAITIGYLLFSKNRLKKKYLETNASLMQNVEELTTSKKDRTNQREELQETKTELTTKTAELEEVKKELQIKGDTLQTREQTEIWKQKINTSYPAKSSLYVAPKGFQSTTIKKHMEGRKTELGAVQKARSTGAIITIQQAYNFNNIALMHQLIFTSKDGTAVADDICIASKQAINQVYNCLMRSHALHITDKIDDIVQYKDAHKEEFELIKWLWKQEKKFTLQDACKMNNIALLNFIIELYETANETIPEEDIRSAYEWCIAGVKDFDEQTVADPAIIQTLKDFYKKKNNIELEPRANIITEFNRNSWLLFEYAAHAAVSAGHAIQTSLNEGDQTKELTVSNVGIAAATIVATIGVAPVLGSVIAAGIGASVVGVAATGVATVINNDIPTIEQIEEFATEQTTRMTDCAKYLWQYTPSRTCITNTLSSVYQGSKNHVVSVGKTVAGIATVIKNGIPIEGQIKGVYQGSKDYVVSAGNSVISAGLAAATNTTTAVTSCAGYFWSIIPSKTCITNPLSSVYQSSKDHVVSAGTNLSNISITPTKVRLLAVGVGTILFLVAESILLFNATAISPNTILDNLYIDPVGHTQIAIPYNAALDKHPLTRI